MASPFPHLNRAPIREALLDIKVEPRPGLSLEVLDAFVDGVRSDFPDVQPIRTMETQLDFSGEEPGVRSSRHQTLGSICWNSAKTRAVQARLDGFSVNQVKGYETWEALRDQAESLWEGYAGVAAPTAVIRCALRYINRLEVPVNQDLSHWLRTRAEVPPELPQFLDDYFARIVLSFGEDRKAAIIQAAEPANGSGARGLLLDIDVFVVKRFTRSDSAGLWAEFEELRTIKNQCFFQSLHPDLVETYK